MTAVNGIFKVIPSACRKKKGCNHCSPFSFLLNQKRLVIQPLFSEYNGWMHHLPEHGKHPCGEMRAVQD